MATINRDKTCVSCETTCVNCREPGKTKRWRENRQTHLTIDDKTIPVPISALIEWRNRCADVRELIDKVLQDV